MTDLMQAHRQWASRRPDERFESIDALDKYVSSVKSRAKQGKGILGALKFEATNEDDLIVVGKSMNADITNYAFSQVCNRLEIPHGISEKLSAPIMADVLNYRIKNTSNPDTEIQILLDQKSNKEIEIRSVTSDRYDRIFNADLTFFLKFLQANGWKVPPARPAYDGQPGSRKATEADVLANNDFWGNVKVGDPIAPAGLYAGDRDMFAVMVNTNDQIDDDSGRKMSRGIFMGNSEVGAGSFYLTQFMMQNICSNHIVWGAKNIVEVRFKHIGDAYDRVMYALDEAKKKIGVWQPAETKKQLDYLRFLEIAPGMDDVISTVYDQRIDQALTQKVLKSSYETSMKFADIDGAKPNSVLGLVNGITRFSQSLPYADARLRLDKAAGKMMDRFLVSMK